MNKISIVTISYNQGKYLRRCIDSVLSQNHSNIELIVVDPGSSDGSREIISSYGDRLVAVFEPDSGPAEGLNNGFRYARGNIYCFINADDFLLPGALEFACGFFSRHSEVDVLYGGGYISNQIGALIRRYFPSLFSEWFYVYGAINLFQQGFFFKAAAFARVGGFNTENRVSWDGEFFLRLKICQCKFYGVSRPLGAFCIHDGTITGSAGYLEKLDAERRRIFFDVMVRPWRLYDRALASILWAVKQVTIILIVMRAYVRGYH